jgi:hypothetical protein
MFPLPPRPKSHFYKSVTRFCRQALPLDRRPAIDHQPTNPQFSILNPKSFLFRCWIFNRLKGVYK